jgi:integrase
MRRGEILGLRWSDINFDSGKLVYNERCIISLSKESLFNQLRMNSLPKQYQYPNLSLVNLKSTTYR